MLVKGAKDDCNMWSQLRSNFFVMVHGQLLSNISWWHHQMETFSALQALCEGNPSITGGLSSQRPVTRSFDVFFDLCLNKRLSKNRYAGDLRRNRAHYDVTVMSWIIMNLFSLLLCSLWWVQIVRYVLTWRSYSFICTLHHLIIITGQAYLKTLNL